MSAAPTGPYHRPRDRSEPLGDVLRRALKRRGLLDPRPRQRVWDAWTHLLGRTADHTRLAALRDHVATFLVDSSPLLSELNNFRKQELLEGLRDQVKSYFVRDIRFRLQKDAPPAPPPQTARRP